MSSILSSNTLANPDRPLYTGGSSVSGVASVNGATGTVVISGANGVGISSGASPVISLGAITPTSVNTAGAVTAASLNTAGTATVNAVNAAGAVAAGSLAVAGAASVVGVLQAAGSLYSTTATQTLTGTPTPYGPVFTKPCVALVSVANTVTPSGAGNIYQNRTILSALSYTDTAVNQLSNFNLADSSGTPASNITISYSVATGRFLFSTSASPAESTTIKFLIMNSQ